MTPEDLAKMLGLAGGREEKPRPIHEAQIAELKMYFEDYRKALVECQFKPGDLVTPKKNSRLHHKGEPYIVLEIFEEPFRFGENHDVSGEIGTRMDMRVLVCQDGFYAAHGVESYAFEKYDPDVHNKKAGRFGATLKEMLGDV